MTTPGRLNAPAGPDDVTWLYRNLLGREPENAAVVNGRVGLPVAAIIAEFLVSEEYRRRTYALETERLARTPPGSEVDLSVTADQRVRLIDHARTTWEKLGREDAFWSVLTQDVFRADALDDTARDAFFLTGEQDVQIFLDACRTARVDPRLDGRVLDFGCGVGRLGVPLARTYGDYLGVDISPPHLAQARQALTDAGLADRARFLLLPEWLDGDDRWDAVFSVIVLQHNAPPVIAEMVRIMLDRLNPGGVAWIQIPHALYDYHYSAREHLADLEGAGGGMEMHPLPQHEMFRLVEDAGCRAHAAIADGRAGLAGLSTGYLLTRPM